MIENKDIGKKVQKAREEKGLKQHEFSKMLGISQSTLSNYELGKRKIPIYHIENIANNLGKPIEYFFKDTNIVTYVNNNKNIEIDETLLKLIDKMKNLDYYSIELLNKYIDFLIWDKNNNNR